MNIDEAQLVPLRDVCDDAKILAEGQYTFVLLTGLRFRSGDATLTMNALLLPQEHEGYVTRLFVERIVPGKGANWKAYPFLGQTWHACSWKDVVKEQTLVEMLYGHLDAFV
ncbi:hypothetical protein KGM48_02820 [Patescibacteria group bacterium]|nr:hypothetical protein [Patescibacteria group bacterium]